MATQTITRPPDTLTGSSEKAEPARVAGVVSMLTLLLALLAALASATGLLAPSVYHDAPTWVAQARGQDLVTLVIVVPLMLAALIAARRGSIRALLVWLGCVGYIAYGYATYAFGTHFNLLFLVYVAAFGVAIYTLVLGLAGLDTGLVARSFDKRTPTRIAGAVLVGMSALTALLWLGQDVPALLSGRVPNDVVEAGLLTNPTHVLDLGLVLPASISAGILLARRRAWGFVLGAYFLVNFAILGVAIVSMTLFMAAGGQAFNVGLSAVFTVWTLTSIALAWRLLSQIHGPVGPL
jgi:hypothetical protein